MARLIRNWRPMCCSRWPACIWKSIWKSTGRGDNCISSISRLENRRRQLEAGQGKLMDFTKSHGVVMAAQQRDLVLQRLNDVEASYQADSGADVGDCAASSRTQMRSWRSCRERTTTQVRTADNPELLRALKASLLDLELKKTQLLTKFEPSHRSGAGS